MLVCGCDLGESLGGGCIACFVTLETWESPARVDFVCAIEVGGCLWWLSWPWVEAHQGGVERRQSSGMILSNHSGLPIGSSASKESRSGPAMLFLRGMLTLFVVH